MTDRNLGFCNSAALLCTLEFCELSKNKYSSTINEGECLKWNGQKLPFVDEFGRTIRLWATDIITPKQELPIQIGEINGIHIDDVNITKAHQTQIFQ